MIRLGLIFILFSTLCFGQSYQIDTIRYSKSIDASLASPLEVELTMRQDFKKMKIKILKGSYIGNIKWLVPKRSLVWAEDDIPITVSRRKLKKIIEESKKIKPDLIKPDWEYENHILDGSWTSLYLSNWFENSKPLELNFRNPDLDTEKRGLSQYYKVLKLIEEVVMY